jgi:hypothetical protein
MFVKMLLSLKMYEKKENLKALSESMVDAIAKEDEQFDVNYFRIYKEKHFFLYSIIYLFFVILAFQ